MRSPALLILSLFIIAACEGSSSNRTNSPLMSTEALNQEQERRYQQADKPLFVAWDKINESLPQFFLPCDDCPTSFGQVISQSTKVDHNSERPRRLRVTNNCQGPMIASNLLLTNKHCLPDDLKTDDVSCRGRLKVVLPEINQDNPLKVLECDRVLQVSPDFGLSEEVPQPDWAIIKLKSHAQHRANEISREGLKDNESLFAFLPTIDKQSQRIQMRSIRCSTIQNSLAMPEFSHDKAPMSFLKCNHDVVSGFSGTPLYRRTDEGFVPVAMISHIWDSQVNGEDIKVSQFVVASNFSCLPDDDGKLPTNCEFDPGQRSDLKSQILAEALNKEKQQQQWEEFQAQWIEADESPIQWEKLNLSDPSTLPPLLQKSVEKRLTSNVADLNLQTKQAVVDTSILAYAHCLKPEAAKQVQKGNKVSVKVPIIHIHIKRGPLRRPHIQLQLRQVEGEARMSTTPGEFVLLSPRPGSRFAQGESPQLIYRDRFNHRSYTFPTCE